MKISCVNGAQSGIWGTLLFLGSGQLVPFGSIAGEMTKWVLQKQGVLELATMFVIFLVHHAQIKLRMERHTNVKVKIHCPTSKSLFTLVRV